MIDLHIHSTASDGSFTPSEILKQAYQLGLTAISITDHDSTDGVKELIESGIHLQPEFITGVEISANPLPGFSGGGSLHILGYGFSVYDTQLKQMLKSLKQSRKKRNPRIIKKLNELGFDITLNEVNTFCGPGQIGRPHIARVMLAKGFVPSLDHAFDNYLGKGKPAYVDKLRFSCQETITTIIKAGGVPVLAHPGLIPTTKENPIHRLISELAEMGLMGLEVYHTDHSPEQITLFKRLALQKGLIATGGTDFHGSLKPEISMGTGHGMLDVNDSLYKELIQKVEKTKKDVDTMDVLEKNLSHTFTDRSLLSNALRHSSYVNELKQPDINDNQRLEFLGDAVLGLCIGHILMDRFPEMNEGELSKFRSALVSESGLAYMARRLDLGRFIALGKGERLSRGAEKQSILADTFEAVIAAIYLDQGFEKTYKLINSHFNEQIRKQVTHAENIDYKSMLQEFVQEMGNISPCYEISAEKGPDHDKTFQVTLNVCNLESKGLGKSKKSAEQNAAENALVLLKQIPSPKASSEALPGEKGIKCAETKQHQ